MWVYVCRLCNREFTDVVELFVHVELEHASDKRVAELIREWKWVRAYAQIW
jgi:hypothetical protein